MRNLKTLATHAVEKAMREAGGHNDVSAEACAIAVLRCLRPALPKLLRALAKAADQDETNDDNSRWWVEGAEASELADELEGL